MNKIIIVGGGDMRGRGFLDILAAFELPRRIFALTLKSGSPLDYEREV
jgi:hypothetical protein